MFANACESGVRPSRPDLSSPELPATFAEAFFKKGVANFICTAWPIGDIPSRDFAVELYTNLIGLGVPGKADERAEILSRAGRGGLSTCVVRAPLDDACCESLFFDNEGNVRDHSEYLEIGRQALKALLDPADNSMDVFRYNFLDDPATWQKALAIGPGPQSARSDPAGLHRLQTQCGAGGRHGRPL